MFSILTVVVTIDLSGAWNSPPSTIFWTQPFEHSQTKTVHWGRRNMYWKVSSFSNEWMNERTLKIRLSNAFVLFHRYGFVIAVTTIDNIGAGVIQPGRGFVLYPVKYKAIVFRPFKGEVVDAVVTQVNKVRFVYLFSSNNYQRNKRNTIYTWDYDSWQYICLLKQNLQSMHETLFITLVRGNCQWAFWIIKTIKHN